MTAPPFPYFGSKATLAPRIAALLALGYRRHIADSHVRYGRVKVDGRVVDDPMRTVGAQQRVTVDLTCPVPPNTTDQEAQ